MWLACKRKKPRYNWNIKRQLPKNNEIDEYRIIMNLNAILKLKKDKSFLFHCIWFGRSKWKMGETSN